MNGGVWEREREETFSLKVTSLGKCHELLE